MPINEYRAYHFVNYYLSPIQHGIQTAHAQVELFRKYRDRAGFEDILYEWADSPTTIVLNGGNNEGLIKLKDTFTDILNYPWSFFNEDDVSLGGLLTNVCVIVPKRVYSLQRYIIESPDKLGYIGNKSMTHKYASLERSARKYFESTYGEPTTEDFFLADLISGYRLI